MPPAMTAWEDAHDGLHVYKRSDGELPWHVGRDGRCSGRVDRSGGADRMRSLRCPSLGRPKRKGNDVGTASEVEAVRGMPEPDTFGVDEPWSQTKFTGWMG
jgi:hypothetical protein